MKKISMVLGAAALILAVTGCASTGKKDSGKTEEKKVVECINNAEPAGAELLDGFEEGNYWYAVGDTWDQWGSHNLSLEAEVVEDWASEGSYCASFTFDIASADTSKQACFCCDALTVTDWSDVKAVVCDINNINDEPINVLVCTQSGEWIWGQNMQPITLGIGVNTNVIFDVTPAAYNDGKGIISSDDMKRLMITVVDENHGGTILVDNVRIVR